MSEKEDSTPEEPTHVASGIGVVGSESAPDPAPADRGPVDEGGPVMDQHPAEEVDKIAGIVVQTRADVGEESKEAIEKALRGRLSDAGIELSEEEIADLAAQVRTGDPE